MKKIVFHLLVFSVLFFSCKKDDNNPSISTSNVTSTVSTGNWRITYYWDTDHDETNNFIGYSFVFNTNGTVTATKAANTITGTWTTRNDDNKIKLVLSFSSPADFIEISDDWHTIERTDSKIKLQDVSGGNGGTDYLTFEKN
ncbi:MAG: hypothetical protein RL528_412 [Bacteroidota bacterium]